MPAGMTAVLLGRLLLYTVSKALLHLLGGQQRVFSRRVPDGERTGVPDKGGDTEVLGRVMLRREDWTEIVIVGTILTDFHEKAFCVPEKDSGMARQDSLEALRSKF